MKIIDVATDIQMILPVFDSVHAGFPSPSGSVENAIDLNEYLIKHPASTFFVRVAGHSMTGKGIHEGDLAIVDKTLDAKNGRIVIAMINSEFTIKEFFKSKNQIILKSANPDYPDIYITEYDDFEIWGVVTNIIHKV